jgi:peptide/nickel transport system ATP-binding protein
MNPPSGCRFHARCPAATSRCALERPMLTDDGDGRLVACHHPLAASQDARKSAPESYGKN